MMKSHKISIPVAPEEARAYAAATPEIRQSIDKALRRQLRKMMTQEPPSDQPLSLVGVEQRLESLVASGQVTRAKKSKEGWTWHTQGADLAEGRTLSLLEEVRADREFFQPGPTKP